MCLEKFCQSSIKHFVHKTWCPIEIWHHCDVDVIRKISPASKFLSQLLQRKLNVHLNEDTCFDLFYAYLWAPQIKPNTYVIVTDSKLVWCTQTAYTCSGQPSVVVMHCISRVSASTWVILWTCRFVVIYIVRSTSISTNILQLTTFGSSLQLFLGVVRHRHWSWPYWASAIALISLCHSTSIFAHKLLIGRQKDKFLFDFLSLHFKIIRPNILVNDRSKKKS